MEKKNFFVSTLVNYAQESPDTPQEEVLLISETFPFISSFSCELRSGESEQEILIGFAIWEMIILERNLELLEKIKSKIDSFNEMVENWIYWHNHENKRKVDSLIESIKSNIIDTEADLNDGLSSLYGNEGSEEVENIIAVLNRIMAFVLFNEHEKYGKFPDDRKKLIISEQKLFKIYEKLEITFLALIADFVKVDVWIYEFPNKMLSKKKIQNHSRNNYWKEITLLKRMDSYRLAHNGIRGPFRLYKTIQQKEQEQKKYSQQRLTELAVELCTLMKSELTNILEKKNISDLKGELKSLLGKYEKKNKEKIDENSLEVRNKLFQQVEIKLYECKNKIESIETEKKKFSVLEKEKEELKSNFEKLKKENDDIRKQMREQESQFLSKQREYERDRQFKEKNELKAASSADSRKDVFCQDCKKVIENKNEEYFLEPCKHLYHVKCIQTMVTNQLKICSFNNCTTNLDKVSQDNIPKQSLEGKVSKNNSGSQKSLKFCHDCKLSIEYDAEEFVLEPCKHIYHRNCIQLMIKNQITLCSSEYCKTQVSRDIFDRNPQKRNSKSEKVERKESDMNCSLCNKKIEAKINSYFQNSCGHFYHKTCLKTTTRTQSLECFSLGCGAKFDKNVLELDNASESNSNTINNSSKKKCSECNKTDENSEEILLHCGHSFHFECIRLVIENGGKFCSGKNCSTKLSKEILEEHNKKNCCEVCKKKGKLQVLNCIHKICEECLVNHLKHELAKDPSLISKGIICPVNDCFERITHEFFRFYLPNKYVVELEADLLKDNKPASCPGCKNLIYKNVKYPYFLFCQNCSLPLCLEENCRDFSHKIIDRCQSKLEFLSKIHKYENQKIFLCPNCKMLGAIDNDGAYGQIDCKRCKQKMCGICFCDFNLVQKHGKYFHRKECSLFKKKAGEDGKNCKDCVCQLPETQEDFFSSNLCLTKDEYNKFFKNKK